MDRRSLTERDICTKSILPALKRAGWDEMLQIREEVYFTKGRIKADVLMALCDRLEASLDAIAATCSTPSSPRRWRCLRPAYARQRNERAAHLQRLLR